MIQPKAVIFDLGKVLLEFDYGIVARRLAAHCSGPLSSRWGQGEPEA